MLVPFITRRRGVWKEQRFGCCRDVSIFLEINLNGISIKIQDVHLYAELEPSVLIVFMNITRWSSFIDAENSVAGMFITYSHHELKGIYRSLRGFVGLPNCIRSQNEWNWSEIRMNKSANKGITVPFNHNSVNPTPTNIPKAIHELLFILGNNQNTSMKLYCTVHCITLLLCYNSFIFPLLPVWMTSWHFVIYWDILWTL